MSIGVRETQPPPAFRPGVNHARRGTPWFREARMSWNHERYWVVENAGVRGEVAKRN
jgi:hypothetical protein